MLAVYRKRRVREKLRKSEKMASNRKLISWRTMRFQAARGKRIEGKTEITPLPVKKPGPIKFRLAIFFGRQGFPP